MTFVFENDVVRPWRHLTQFQYQGVRHWIIDEERRSFLTVPVCHGANNTIIATILSEPIEEEGVSCLWCLQYAVRRLV